MQKSENGKMLMKTGKRCHSCGKWLLRTWAAAWALLILALIFSAVVGGKKGVVQALLLDVPHDNWYLLPVMSVSYVGILIGLPGPMLYFNGLRLIGLGQIVLNIVGDADGLCTDDRDEGSEESPIAGEDNNGTTGVGADNNEDHPSLNTADNSNRIPEASMDLLNKLPDLNMSTPKSSKPNSISADILNKHPNLNTNTVENNNKTNSRGAVPQDKRPNLNIIIAEGYNTSDRSVTAPSDQQPDQSRNAVKDMGKANVVATDSPDNRPNLNRNTVEDKRKTDLGVADIFSEITKL